MLEGGRRAAAVFNEAGLGGAMASKTVERGWAKAQQQIDAGEHEQALETLRAVWGEEGADVGQTWRIAAEAKAGLARETNEKKLYRESVKHYEAALKLSPNDKLARRGLNSLRSHMDGMGIRAGGRAVLWDDGAPTFVGVVSIVLVIGMVLIGLKVVPEYLAKSSDTSVASEYNATIEFTLFADDAPYHVESFKQHAQNGAYDGVVFHRIIDNFMIQGGDIQNGDGSGGWAAKFYGYCDGQMQESCGQTQWTIPDEADNGRGHVPGALSMAKTSSPHTAGSQFFFVDKGSTPSHLDGVHTVFGQATGGQWFNQSMSGTDVIDKISEIAVNDQDYPTDLIPTIRSVTIEGNVATMNIEMVDASGMSSSAESSPVEQPLPGFSLLAGMSVLVLAAVASRRW